MKYLRRHLLPVLLITASACGGVASTGSNGGDGDGDDDRSRRPGGRVGDGDDRPVAVSGDGDGDDDPVVVVGSGGRDSIVEPVCRVGEIRACMHPEGCISAHEYCLSDGGWGVCTCDGSPGAGGASVGGPDPGLAADFVEGGRGTWGTWDGYLFTASEAGSTIQPSEILGKDLCVSGTLGAGYEEWALLGWNIAQDIDPETFEGGAVNAISPGGTGVEVQVLNNGGSGLRVQIQTDEAATESWCASVPPAGGVIPWSDFRKECWTTGGEAYDGVTPISLVTVLTYAGSDTLPTNFDFCVLHLGPTL